jgi:MFS family permease
MLTELGASPRMLVLVQVSTSLPIMPFSLWSDAMVDNLDRRRILLSAHLFILLVSTVLALGAWFGWMMPLSLLAAIFIIGCGTAAVQPAAQVAVGEIVPRPLLSGAVAYKSMSFNIARRAGPAVGGAIAALAEAAGAFFFNALSYIGMIFVIWRAQPVRPLQRLPR